MVIDVRPAFLKWFRSAPVIVAATLRLQLLLVPVLLAACGDNAAERILADLRSEQVQVRRKAVRELGAFRRASPEVVQAVQGAVTDPDREVRRMACRALGEWGAFDPALQQTALEDPEISVRLAAAFAVLKSAPQSEPAVAVLRQAMLMGEGGVMVAVSRMGARAEWAVPTFIELLRDRRAGVRRLAAEGLADVAHGAHTAEVVSALERARRDSDDRVREAATQSLERLQRGHAP